MTKYKMARWLDGTLPPAVSRTKGYSTSPHLACCRQRRSAARRAEQYEPLSA
jgi:hypothetical protein